MKTDRGTRSGLFHILALFPADLKWHSCCRRSPPVATGDVGAKQSDLDSQGGTSSLGTDALLIQSPHSGVPNCCFMSLCLSRVFFDPVHSFCSCRWEDESRWGESCVRWTQRPGLTVWRVCWSGMGTLTQFPFRCSTPTQASLFFTRAMHQLYSCPCGPSVDGWRAEPNVSTRAPVLCGAAEETSCLTGWEPEETLGFTDFKDVVSEEQISPKTGQTQLMVSCSSQQKLNFAGLKLMNKWRW